MSARTMLAAALEHVERGWFVLPLHTAEVGVCSCGDADCAAPGKHPRSAHGVKDATQDQAMIADWWTRWPDANIGGATGAASGVVALDIDPRHDGDASLAELEASEGPLPETVESVTGGGGRHVLFRYPPGGLRSRAGIRPGLDVRGDGGYIVLPPSVHSRGRSYSWELSCHPDDIPLAEVPGWLFELIRRRSPNGNGPSPEAESVSEGARNDALTSLSGTMRRRGMGEESIRAALHAENRRICRPPLDDTEVDHIAHSVSRYEPEDPVVLADRPQIQVAGRQDSLLLSEARAALARRFPGALFYREGRLVTLDDRDLRPVSRGELHDRLAVSARWVRATSEGLVSAAAPKRIIEALQESPGSPIPTVKNVMHVPAFVGEHCQLVVRPGLDSEAETLFVGSPMELEVPPEPTPDDIQEARAILDSWLEEFPFSDTTARAHAVAFLITLLVRHTIHGRTPLFLIEAATPGTGKTLLAEVMGLAAHGVSPISTHYTRDGEEFGKRIASWVIAGRPLAFLDNLSRISGEASHVLSSIITTGSIEVRAMRELRAAGGEWTGTIVASGNNVSLSEEMPRRVCRIRLDSPENPALRKFRRDDLHEWTLAHRRDLVRAVAIVVAAWRTVDFPPGRRVRPSFVAWSRTVGGILGCLDSALADAFLDPEDLAMMMALDEGNEDLRGLIDAWRTRSDATSARLATKEILALADQAGVLDRVVGDGNGQSRASRLGRYLKKHHGKVVSGHRLVGVQDSHAKSLRWQLLRVEDESR